MNMSDNEEIKQENHSLKKKLAMVELNQNHLQQENEVLFAKLEEALKSAHDHENCGSVEKKLRDRLIHIENEEETWKFQFKEEIKDFKKTIEELRNKLVLKDEELNALREDSISVCDLNNSQSDRLSAQIIFLEEQLQNQTKEHELFKIDVTREIAELKEELEMKNDSLGETKNLMKNYKELFENAEGELANLKLAPKDVNERGNSIFGELEDRRVKAELLLNKERNRIKLLKERLKVAENEKNTFSDLYQNAISKKNIDVYGKIELSLKNLNEENDKLKAELENERNNCHHKVDYEQHLKVCKGDKKTHEALFFISSQKNRAVKMVQQQMDEVRSRYWAINMKVPNMEIESSKLKELNQYLLSKCTMLKQYCANLKKYNEDLDLSSEEKENISTFPKPRRNILSPSKPGINESTKGLTTTFEKKPDSNFYKLFESFSVSELDDNVSTYGAQYFDD